MEVTEAEVGRSRKKREAQADPTFFGRPAEPEPSGEGPAKGNRPRSQDLGRNPAADLSDLPMHRYPHDVLLPRIWELRHNLTAYDAVYVALAEALDAPLLTRDRRLATASGHGARVDLV
jgi:hypothetical protein